MAAPTATTATPPRVKLNLAEYRRIFKPGAGNFGRKDLTEYRELDRNISVGNSEIGGVSVDCRFNFSKTRWGVVENQPGGIFYMDLTINQPLDWRLREATVSIILDDLKPTTPNKADTKTPRDVSVGLETEYYGPKSLVGPELKTEKMKSYNIGPQAEVMGFGGSLGEFGSTVTLPRTSWWNFQGTPKTAKGSPQQYTILTWTMSQNALAYSTEHPARIETAFTFFHKYQPFSLRVEIEGKLRHLHHKYKDKAIGLFTKAKREKPIMLVFRFDPGAEFKDQLLSQAKLLESDMAKLACERKHVEVSQRASAQSLDAGNAPQNGTTQKNDQSIATTTVTKSAEPAVTSNAPPVQDALTTQLLLAHTALLNNTAMKPPQKIPQEPLPVKEPMDMTLSHPVQDASQEEVVKALQNMPWWIVALLVRIFSALSISTAPEPEKKTVS